jgi:hypothetical protein
VSDLRAAFVAAFDPYVLARIADRLGDVAAPGLGDAVAEGAAWLDAHLGELLSLDPSRQRSSPLQLFQAALAYPTAALAAAGVEPVGRDAAAVAALPGDSYDLAPTSSQALGEEAWHAHIAWGIAKAESVAGVVPAPRPRSRVDSVAALVSIDLMDRSKFEAAAAAAGYALVVWRNPGAIEAGLDTTAPAVVFVDLTHRFADGALRLASGRGAAVVAYGPHVDDLALARARTLGADIALPRSRLFAALARHFPPLV